MRRQHTQPASSSQYELMAASEELNVPQRVFLPNSEIELGHPPVLLTRSRLGKAGLSLCMTVFPLYFVVFGALVYVQDGQPSVSQLSAGLLRAATYGPTIFPIVFAAIFGRHLKTVAGWSLERGTTIGLIECLLASRSVANAVISPFRLQHLSPLTFFLIVLWSLSPLGGQASLRVASTGNSSQAKPNTFFYLDTTRSGLLQFYRSREYAIGVTFTTALVSPQSVKNISQDMFGNIKIPMLEPLMALQKPNAAGWYDLHNQSNLIYSSLIGVPFFGTSSNANASFTVETSYLYADCNITSKSSSANPVGPPFSNTDDTVFNGAYLSIDVGNSHNYNSTMPREIIVYSIGAQILSQLSCPISIIYVEVEVHCVYQVCNATAIRPSTMERKHSPAIIPEFDIVGTQMAGNFFGQFVNTSVNAHGTQSSPIESYILNPTTPLSGNWQSISWIGTPIISQRFLQLVNTYWLASISPDAVTGSFNSSEDGYYYTVANTTGRIEQDIEILQCHKTWLAVLFISALVMFIAGALEPLIDICRRGPDVLDSFTGLVRDNPYIQKSGGSSLEDGICQARRLRSVRVRLGDVKPYDDIGYVAIGTPNNQLNIQPVVKERRYK